MKYECIKLRYLGDCVGFWLASVIFKIRQTGFIDKKCLYVDY